MANHPIVHIDIPATHTKEAAEFYAKTFDWKLEHAPEFDYWQFAAEGGPGGGFMQAGGVETIEQGATINQLVVYIGTDDIDESLASIEANGGKTIQPRTEIPGIGWYAVFSDPAGNALALYKSMT